LHRRTAAERVEAVGSVVTSVRVVAGGERDEKKVVLEGRAVVEAD
jgi:hypothetical protein